MGTFKAAENPGAQYERQYAKWQQYLTWADEAPSEWEAKMWRRKAHGVRSALTRLAKREGWV